MTRTHTTSYEVCSLDLAVNAMVLRASRLAPRVTSEAIATAKGFDVTTPRPSGPNQAKAWDLISNAFLLCAIRRNSLLAQKAS